MSDNGLRTWGTTSANSNSKICLCCGCITTITCMKGACSNCHSGGLCHH